MNKGKKLHTFVLPTYQESVYLEECIQSIQNQTVPGNIIISTSTPNDYVSRLAEKYDIPVKVNEHGDGNIVANWNFALSCGKTKYCTLAHQDDIYLPEYVEKMLELAEKHPNTTITFCNYYELKAGTRSYWKSYLFIKRLLLWPFYLKPIWQTGLIKKLILRFGCPICCPSVMFNLEKLEGFEFDHEFSINLDWNAWRKLANSSNNAFCFAPEALVCHRLCPENETSQGVLDNRRYNEDLKMFKSYWPNWFAKLLVRFYSNCYSKELHKD